jgi:hypothetical protein
VIGATDQFRQDACLRLSRAQTVRDALVTGREARRGSTAS